jgi:hypothetical protein
MVWWYLLGDSPGERGGAPHGFEFSGAAFGRLFTLQALCKLHEKTSRERGNFWPLTAITLSGVNGFEIAIAPVGRRRQLFVRQSEAPRSLTTRAK